MNKTKILIIEDEKPIARFLDLELSHEGYMVDIAYDGRTGLEKAVADDEYSLILLDIMLPGINGIEVLRRIRQTISTPILMLTALDEITDKVMGLDTGADDYITCLLYTSDAADEEESVDLGGRRIIKKKKKNRKKT